MSGLPLTADLQRLKRCSGPSTEIRLVGICQITLARPLIHRAKYAVDWDNRSWCRSAYPSRAKARLSAILAADAAGHSRLAQPRQLPKRSSSFHSA